MKREPLKICIFMIKVFFFSCEEVEECWVCDCVCLSAFVNTYRTCVSGKNGGCKNLLRFYVNQCESKPKEIACCFFFKEMEKMCDKKAFHPWVSWLKRRVSTWVYMRAR